MATVKAILTKPLDGDPEGTEREFSQTDFDRLKGLGAVKAASEKAAEAPQNKAAPPVENKAAPATDNKDAGQQAIAAEDARDIRVSKPDSKEKRK